MRAKRRLGRDGYAPSSEGGFMYYCNNCRQWVSGSWHYCWNFQPATMLPQPTYFYPIESLQPTLERIARALETIVEQNNKKA